MYIHMTSVQHTCMYCNAANCFYTLSASHPNKLASSANESNDDNSGTNWSLERAQTELRETKERNSYLEKECVVYQSQLKVKIIL